MTAVRLRSIVSSGLVSFSSVGTTAFTCCAFVVSTYFESLKTRISLSASCLCSYSAYFATLSERSCTFWGHVPTPAVTKAVDAPDVELSSLFANG